ncbi:MAG: hemerythrin domain-containing protein [Candidatus Binatia bacterium]
MSVQQRDGRSTRHRVAASHRRLDALFAKTRTAFERDLDTARRAFGQLHDALAVHFAQEAQLYYPPIWTLRPERKESLAAFLGQHETFCAQLVEIRQHLDRGLLSPARHTLATLVDTFRMHEAGEEGVLRLVEEEVAAAKAD